MGSPEMGSEVGGQLEYLMSEYNRLQIELEQAAAGGDQERAQTLYQQLQEVAARLQALQS